MPKKAKAIKKAAKGAKPVKVILNKAAVYHVEIFKRGAEQAQTIEKHINEESKDGFIVNSILVDSSSDGAYQGRVIVITVKH
jgi:hypothetical protein